MDENAHSLEQRAIEFLDILECKKSISANEKEILESDDKLQSAIEYLKGNDDPFSLRDKIYEATKDRSNDLK